MHVFVNTGSMQSSDKENLVNNLENRLVNTSKVKILFECMYEEYPTKMH